MLINQVVVKFKTRKMKKGNTKDFLPNKETFHLTNRKGEVEVINVDDCKAIFFVKDLDGNKDYNYTYDDVVPGGGKMVSVDFNDGENVIGYVLSYSPNRQGFFITPADLSGNNQRIYAVTSFVKKVEFI